MKPDSKQLRVIGHNVVIDNGTNTVKGGFSDSDAPQCRIPTIVGHGRHKVILNSAKCFLVKWYEMIGLNVKTFVGCWYSFQKQIGYRQKI